MDTNLAMDLRCDSISKSDQRLNEELIRSKKSEIGKSSNTQTEQDVLDKIEDIIMVDDV